MPLLICKITESIGRKIRKLIDILEVLEHAMPKQPVEMTIGEQLAVWLLVESVVWANQS